MQCIICQRYTCTNYVTVNVDIQMGLYNFRPSVRPVPLEIHMSGFPGKHYCPRMATMNRPTFQSIRQYSPAQPALIFVSSRRQTRLTALDLIAFLAAEDEPKQWLHMDESVSFLFLLLKKICCHFIFLSLVSLDNFGSHNTCVYLLLIFYIM